MENFFLAAGTADMETLHSATIAWLLSNGSPINLEGRSKIVKQLFCLTDNKFNKFDSIEAETEWNHVDILITTVTDGKTTYWAIENKISSRQHDNQLVKYDFYLDALSSERDIRKNKTENNDKISLISSHRKELRQRAIELNLIKEDAQNPVIQLKNKKRSNIGGRILLGLVEEVPESENWEYVSYAALRDALKPYAENKDKESVLYQYYECIDTLLSYMDHPEKHLNVVFGHEGDEIIEKNSLQKIIQSNYLLKVFKETINQKAYIDAGKKGTISISFVFFGDKKQNGCIEMSFQDGTFKFTLMQDYGISFPEKPTELSLFKEKWGKIIEDIVDEKAGNKFSVFEGPRSKKRVSKNENINNWWLLDKEKMKKEIEVRFNLCKEMAGLLHRKCINDGMIFND